MDSLCCVAVGGAFPRRTAGGEGRAYSHRISSHTPISRVPSPSQCRCQCRRGQEVVWQETA